MSMIFCFQFVAGYGNYRTAAQEHVALPLNCEDLFPSTQFDRSFQAPSPNAFAMSCSSRQETVCKCAVPMPYS